MPFERLLNGFTGERLLPPRAPRSGPSKSRLGPSCQMGPGTSWACGFGPMRARRSGPKGLDDLCNRSTQDIPIAALDGIEAFPQKTRFQTCIGHLPRHSMSFASLKGPWAPWTPRSRAAIRSPNTRHRTGDGPRPIGSRSSTTRPRGTSASTPQPRSGRGSRSPAGRFGPGDTSRATRQPRNRSISICLAPTATSREWARAVRQWRAVKNRRAIVFQYRFPMAPSKHRR